jgi:hypothetical protein
VPRIRIDGQAGREAQRAFVEPFDAQELVAERLLDPGRSPTPGQRRHEDGAECVEAAGSVRGIQPFAICFGEG